MKHWFFAVNDIVLWEEHITSIVNLYQVICVLLFTPKDQKNLPIDLKFYHMLFNEFKDDIVKNTKAGTSKEAIGLKSIWKLQVTIF
ncbi:MAG: hypothetical protein U0T80_03630 [Flavobacteriaceae bacterium]